MDFLRNVIGNFTVETVRDSVFIEFEMPGGNVDVAEILQQHGIANARTVYLNAVSAPKGTDFSYIRGNTTISNVPAGVRVGLRVNGFPVKGFAYKEDVDPNTYAIKADSGVFKLRVAANKVAITNGGVNYVGENLVGDGGAIEFADTAISDATLEKSLQKRFGIHPNNKATLDQAPYVSSFALPQYLNGGDRSFYPLNEGNSCTFVQNGASISRFIIDAEGGLLSEEVVFDYKNTGPNLDANEVPSTAIPLNGTLPADGEMTINGFATESLPDGSIVLVATYNRHKGTGSVYSEAETGGVIFVYDSNGEAIDGTREIKYLDTTTSLAFNRQILAIERRGLTPPDNENFFVAFTEGGRAKSSGFFVNGTDSQDIDMRNSIDFPSLNNPSRQELSPQEFAKIAFDGNNLVVTSLYDPTNKLGQIASAVTHFVSAGESYMAGAQCLADGKAAPQNIILSADAANATITFLPNCEYNIIGQCNNTSFVFPQSMLGQNITLSELVGVDGNVSTAVHLPNNTNITFVGEDKSCIMSNVVQQLQNTTVTTSTTAGNSSSTNVVTAVPSFSSSSLTTSSTIATSSSPTGSMPDPTSSSRASSSASTASSSLLSSLSSTINSTASSGSGSTNGSQASASPTNSSVTPMLNVTMTPLLPTNATNNVSESTTAVVPNNENGGVATSKIITIAIPSVAGTIGLAAMAYHYRNSIANVGIRFRNFVAGLFGEAPENATPLRSTEREWRFRRRGSRITPVDQPAEQVEDRPVEQENYRIRIDRLEVDRNNEVAAADVRAEASPANGALQNMIVSPRSPEARPSENDPAAEDLPLREVRGKDSHSHPQNRLIMVESAPPTYAKVTSAQKSDSTRTLAHSERNS